MAATAAGRIVEMMMTSTGTGTCNIGDRMIIVWSLEKAMRICAEELGGDTLSPPRLCAPRGTAPNSWRWPGRSYGRCVWLRRARRRRGAASCQRFHRSPSLRLRRR